MLSLIHKMETKSPFRENRVIIFLLSVIVILLVTVIIMIDSWKPEYSSIGAIGDAFNGLTAPIIAIISAGLIFYSFQAQVKANALLSGQWSFDTYIKMFNELKESYEKIEIGFSRPTINLINQPEYGKEALLTIGSEDLNMIHRHNQALKDFKSFLDEFLLFVDILNKNEFNQKVFLSYKVIRFYDEQVKDVYTSYNKTPSLGHKFEKLQPCVIVFEYLQQAINELERTSRKLSI